MNFLCNRWSRKYCNCWSVNSVFCQSNWLRQHKNLRICICLIQYDGFPCTCNMVNILVGFMVLNFQFMFSVLTIFSGPENANTCILNLMFSSCRVLMWFKSVFRCSFFILIRQLLFSFEGFYTTIFLGPLIAVWCEPRLRV